MINSLQEAATYTTHNKQKRRRFRSSAGFEPAIPASKGSQTYAFDSADIETGSSHCTYNAIRDVTAGKSTVN
jgi:hypothetical protein